jgi:pimeloyl-ACP methyl ester carboxylesterase
MALVLLPGSDGKPSRVIGYDRFEPGSGTVASAEPAPPAHPAILFIPGFTLGRRRWPDDFCQRFVDQGFTVVRMDNRDSGDSTRYEALGAPDVKAMLGRSILGLKTKPVPYDLEAMADDALGLMEALGFPRFHVVGASMGGMIVQLLALRSPSALLSAGIIMSSPGGRRYSFAKLSALRALLRVPPLDREGQIEHFTGVLRLLGGERPFEEARIHAFVEDQLTARPSRPGMARQFAAILASSRSRLTRLREIRLPTVVIHGSADPLLPLRGARALARRIKDARLVIVAGMGHDLPESVYDEVTGALLDNIRRASL